MRADANVTSVGQDGLLLEVDDPAGWFASLWQARAAGRIACVEIVPGARTVLLAGVANLEQARTVIPTLEPSSPDPEGGEIEIPIHWDGDDLTEVRAAWGEDPVAVLQATRLRVAFCGFAPGFAYLTGLPERLQLPRRATPRPRVPAGSLATAGPYVGVYPRETPGGWHLLGRTDAVLFDTDREPPALLTPGLTVRLVNA